MHVSFFVNMLCQSRQVKKYFEERKIEREVSHCISPEKIDTGK